LWLLLLGRLLLLRLQQLHKMLQLQLWLLLLSGGWLLLQLLRLPCRLLL
jgi:hypothetical protein